MKIKYIEFISGIIYINSIFCNIKFKKSNKNSIQLLLNQFLNYI